MAKTERTPFEQALLDVAQEEFSSIPAEQEITTPFSPRMQRMGDKLLRRVGRGYRHPVSTTIRRAIIIAAIASVLITTAVATVPPAPKPFESFVVKKARTHFTFTFDPETVANAPDYLEKVYRLSYIPEGYEENTKIIHFGGASYIWKDQSSENYISFSQTPIPEYTSSGPNAEGVTTDVLELDGYEVFCVYDDGAIMYYWIDGEYLFRLVCDPDISEKEAQKIFSSIAVDEDAIIE